MLPHTHRLVEDREYARVRRYGRDIRIRGARIRWAYARHRTTRVGVVISKKVEKRATRRNRIRRVIREGLRPLLPRLRSGVDMVISVSEPIDVSSTEMRNELEHVLTQVRLLRSP